MLPITLLSFLLIPYWLVNVNIKTGTKLLLSIAVGAISIVLIISFSYLARDLQRFLLVFCVLVITSLTVDFIKKRRQNNTDYTK